MVARVAQYTEINPLFGFRAERLCVEPYAHGDLTLCAQIGCDGRVKPETRHQNLVLGLPSGVVRTVDLVDKRSVEMDLELPGLRWEMSGRNLSVLVGVREAVHNPRGSCLGSGCNLYGCSDSINPSPYLMKRRGPVASGTPYFPDVGFVDLLIPIDRELMLSAKGPLLTLTSSVTM